VGVPLMVIGIGLLGFILSVVATALIASKTKELKGMNSVTFSGHLVLINFPGLPKLLRLLDELTNDPRIGRSAQVVLVDKDLDELPSEWARARCVMCAVTRPVMTPCSAPV
jgi:voltage-gated potassium channel